MNVAFDHLVWFVKNPGDAIPLMDSKGFHAVKGGSHQHWGTCNSLCYFGLSYIEFLGIEDRSTAAATNDNRLIKQIVKEMPGREGPARIALRTNDMNEAVAHMKKIGMPVYGPYPGSRVTTDGQLIEWSLLFPEDETSELCLPFIIQWRQTDKERQEELAQKGMIGDHPLGKPEFNQVGFVVKDLDRTCTQWEQLFGLKSGERFIDRELNAECRILELPGNRLFFYSPLGEGAALRELATRGERPFLVGFRHTNRTEEIHMMNGIWKLS